MRDKLTTILEEAKERLAKAASISEAEEIRVNLLGKRGSVTEILRSMKDMAPEERKDFGQAANKPEQPSKKCLNPSLTEVKAKAQAAKFEAEKIDVTEPGKPFNTWRKASANTSQYEEISSVFKSMGFSASRRDRRLKQYSTTSMRLMQRPNHPCKRYDRYLLYHEDNTSENADLACTGKNAARAGSSDQSVYAPGRCFRCDTPDATHSPMFHQVEGLLVDEGITMADLKGRLRQLCKADVRILCTRQSSDLTTSRLQSRVLRWTYHASSAAARAAESAREAAGLRYLGCGMVHPNVLKVGGVDTEKYTGFAFRYGC